MKEQKCDSKEKLRNIWLCDDGSEWSSGRFCMFSLYGPFHSRTPRTDLGGWIRKLCRGLRSSRRPLLDLCLGEDLSEGSLGQSKYENATMICCPRAVFWRKAEEESEPPSVLLCHTSAAFSGRNSLGPTRSVISFVMGAMGTWPDPEPSTSLQAFCRIFSQLSPRHGGQAGDISITKG